MLIVFCKRKNLSRIRKNCTASCFFFHQLDRKIVFIFPVAVFILGLPEIKIVMGEKSSFRWISVLTIRGFHLYAPAPPRSASFYAPRVSTSHQKFQNDRSYSIPQAWHLHCLRDQHFYQPKCAFGKRTSLMHRISFKTSEISHCVAYLETNTPHLLSL